MSLIMQQIKPEPLASISSYLATINHLQCCKVNNLFRKQMMLHPHLKTPESHTLIYTLPYLQIS
jgi:hypothetical protein